MFIKVVNYSVYKHTWDSIMLRNLLFARGRGSPGCGRPDDRVHTSPRRKVKNTGTVDTQCCMPHGRYSRPINPKALHRIPRREQIEPV